jgi:hypothetical protein
MRAAKGIFRTVDKPFGQVDARPSKSYRISWIGVRSRAAPRTSTPSFSEAYCLDVKFTVRFHRPGLSVNFPHLLIHFEFFGHRDSQLGQVATPLRFRDVGPYPALQGLQAAVFQ